MSDVLWGDELSKQIYGELSLLNRTGNLRYLINSHKLQGIDTDPLIKLHVEVIRRVKEEKKKVILWGLGERIMSIRDMEEKLYNAIGYANWPFLCDLPITYCCDKKFTSGQFHIRNKDVPIISTKQAMEVDNAIYLVGTIDFYDEVKQELISNGINRNDIYLYVYGKARVDDKKQYFDDFMVPMKEDIVVDAGAYDGDSIWRFISWNDSHGYEKIVGCEPDYSNYLLCCENCKINKKIQIYNVGVGSKDEDVGFEMTANSGAFFSSNSANRVRVNTIDNLCKGQKVSFIKMDVEGYELSALEGAVETIKKNHPRLAICVYHRKEDLDNVISYLLKVDPTYKFFIRTYSNIYMETVLYAI